MPNVGKPLFPCSSITRHTKRHFWAVVLASPPPDHQLPSFRSMSSSSSVVVLDNGAGLLKAGFGGDRDPVEVVPNCLARAPSHSSTKIHHHKYYLAADQLLSPDLDVTSLPLRRPHDRGYLINPDAQRDVWERALRHLLRCDPRDHPLLLVEPLFNLPSLQRSSDELVFEDLCFPSLCVADPPSLVHLYEASHKSSPVTSHCSLVLDSGFSFTHAAPVVQNFTLNYAVRRVDVGGKALTNYLKELISYRTVNVMEETVLVDDAKEKLCFVSMDVRRDLDLARKPGKDNPFRCTYVLPDGVTSKRGFVKDMDEAQRFLQLDGGELPGKVVPKNESAGYKDADDADARRKIDLSKNEVDLTNERFLVPELLFHPADLGMNEAGLAECIVRAVNSCHPHLHPVLFESIILTGGNTLFPRFAERLEMELRPLVPDNYKVKITRQKEPILGVWRGGSLLASSPDFEAMCVTKAEYEENGSARCRRRFFH